MNFIVHREERDQWTELGTYDAPSPLDAVGIAIDAMDEDAEVAGCYGVRPKAQPEGPKDLYRVDLGADLRPNVKSVDVC